MTLKTNARIAGTVLLLYIATGITSMVLNSQATGGAHGTAEKLASMAEHATLMRVDILLSLLCAAYAMILAITIYALTRDQDADLARMAMCCRLGEAGVIAAIGSLISLGLLSVATSNTSATGSDAAVANALGGLLLKMGDLTGMNIAGTCFAVGSTIYSYLFLRARSIPVPLAWLGVVASALLVVALPLQLTGFLEGPVTTYIWLPMLAFEVPLGWWLIVKGVAVPAGK
jgi:Domain of unknown function (DUF4386)